METHGPEPLPEGLAVGLSPRQAARRRLFWRFRWGIARPRRPRRLERCHMKKPSAASAAARYSIRPRRPRRARGRGRQECLRPRGAEANVSRHNILRY